jgi:hypothetical protein
MLDFEITACDLKPGAPSSARPLRKGWEDDCFPAVNTLTENALALGNAETGSANAFPPPIVI